MIHMSRKGGGGGGGGGGDVCTPTVKEYCVDLTWAISGAILGPKNGTVAKRKKCRWRICPNFPHIFHIGAKGHHLLIEVS